MICSKTSQRACGTLSFTKMKSLHMFRFRVRKNTGLLLKFTQTAVLFQDTSIFFSLEIELSLSSGSYFFFRKLLFHFTLFPLSYFCLFERRVLSRHLKLPGPTGFRQNQLKNLPPGGRFSFIVIFKPVRTTWTNRVLLSLALVF